MASNRIILLGTCGIDKRAVARRLVSACHGHQFRVVNFEHEYLKYKPFSSFLSDPPHEQFRQWREAWRQFELEFLETTVAGTDAQQQTFKSVEENVLLVLHGSIVKGDYGVRVPYDVTCLQRFEPGLIITLIDDVYDLWWRTEARAKGEDRRGRPTLEQLLLARRAEQLAGDQIANHTDLSSRHFVLSIQHPSEAAARLILDKPTMVYLSFPISEPRRMQACTPADGRGVRLINQLHKKAADYQRKNQHVVFISPLGIDELPLARRLDDADVRKAVKKTAKRKDPPPVLFDRRRERWSLKSFCGSNESLSPGPPSKREQVGIPYEQLLHAAGAIRAEVRSRDYRLVLQADTLAVFNPVINNASEVSRGVRNEIIFASTNPRNRGIYVYQDLREDKKNRFQDWLGKEGSLGSSTFAERITTCNSINELLERASAR